MAVWNGRLIGIAALLAATSMAPAVQAAAMVPELPLNHYANSDSSTSQDFWPRVATDGNGNWLSTWVSVSELRFAHSTDGQSWASLPTTFPVKWFREAELVYAGDGHWVSMWLNHNEGETSRTISYSISTDLGDTWSSPQKMPFHATVMPSNNLRVESDGQGNLIAAWMAENYPIEEYLLSRSSDYGLTWSVPEIWEGEGVLATMEPRLGLASVGDSTWLLGYPSDWDYYIAKSVDNGISWDVLGKLPYYNSSHGVGMAAYEGEVALAAAVMYIPPDEQPAQRRIAVYTSDDSLTTFTNSQWLEIVSPDPDYYQGTRLDMSVDAEGNWLLMTDLDPPGPNPHPIKLWQTDDISTTWTLWHEYAQKGSSQISVAAGGSKDFVLLTTGHGDTYDSVDEDIFAISTVEDGTWSDPVYVNPTTDLGFISDTNPILASDDHIIIAAWAARINGVVDRILYSRSFDRGLTWQPAREVPGAAGQLINFRYVGSATWECHWQERSDRFKSISTDGGLTWSAPEGTSERPVTERHVVDAGNGELVEVFTEVVEDPADYFTLNTYSKVSSDGGNTWHSQILVQSQGREAAPWVSVYEGSPQIVSLGNGRLALLGKNTFYGRSVPFDVNHLLQFHAFLAESTDYGRTWSVPETVTTSTWMTRPDGNMNIESCNDRVVIVWARRSSVTGDTDIYYRSKTFGSASDARDWTLYE